MPDRILRHGILTSDAVNELSWQSEVFYRRLMSVVDDFGLFDGRPSIIRSQLYPLKIDRVSESDIGKWMGECSKAGLVRCYSVDGRPYIEVLKFDQRLRQKRVKWPHPPPHDSNMLTSDSNMPPETNLKRNESESESETKCAGAPPRPKFEIPSIEAVKLQCVKIGLAESESIRFVSYYESNGWKVGKNPMRSWPAALQNWKLNSQKYENNGRNNAVGSRPLTGAEQRQVGIPEQKRDYNLDELLEKSAQKQLAESKNRT